MRNAILYLLQYEVDDVWCLPADQAEPWEAIVKRVTSCHDTFTLLCGIIGHISSMVIHLSHEVKPLPAGRGNAD